MKGRYLFFLLLGFSVVTWIQPASIIGAEATKPQRQAVLTIINELLLFKPDILATTPSSVNTPPADSQQNNPGTQGFGITANGFQITIGGPGDRQILIRTADGLLFNLTKVGSSGAEVRADSRQWSCLMDNLTGLIWEKKTSDGRLHDQKDSFVWYNTDPTTNGGAVGFANNSGPTCEGYAPGDPSTYCNTQAFVERVNDIGHCGSKNWRVPTIKELRRIVSLHRVVPDFYRRFFPRGVGNAVWTASVVPRYPGFAWHIYLNDGYAHGIDRSGNLPVLLVHSVQQ